MKIAPSSKPRYPAEDYGAKCSECPLNGSKPVPPQRSSHPRLTVVVDSPGATEVSLSAPLIGPSGELFDKALELENIHRDTLHITHAILCRPPAKFSPADWKKALTCCRPRLLRELTPNGNKSPESTPETPKYSPSGMILALGEKSQYTLTGKAKLLDWMGPPTKGTIWKTNGQLWKPLKTRPLPPDDAIDFSTVELISTFNPGFLLANPHYNPVFRKHLRHTHDRAKGTLPDWKWPQEHTQDGPALQAALWEIFLYATCVGTDTETTGLDPYNVDLLNVGIADATHAVSVEWQTASTLTKNLALAILADETISKSFWNMNYDLQVYDANNMKVGGRCDDWMLAHQIFAPRVSHKLTHASCFEFSVERWKTTFHGSERDGPTDFLKADPQQRALYNARDTWVTYLFAAPFGEYLADTHNGWALYENALANTHIAMKMQRNGVKINRERWAERFKDCTEKLEAAEARLKRICTKLGVENFNHKSYKQRNKLFQDTLEVVLPRNKKGAPSLDKKALEDFCAHLDERVRVVARAMLDGRSAKRKLDYLGALNVDYAHSTFRPGKAKTGRWASSDPNLLNIPKPIKDPQTKEVTDVGLRVVFEARPGNYFVEIDYSAVEGRILALIVGDKNLLEWFATGVDVHVRTAALLLGKSDKEVTKDERENAKMIRYAFHYGSTPETAYRQGVVKNKNLTLPMVEKLFAGLTKLHPEIVKYHTDVVKRAEADDFVEDALSGRRHHFHGLVDRNQCLNLPIQTFASYLIDKALQRIVARLNPDERVLMQVHDSLLLEGPDWKRLYTIMREEMERPVSLRGNTFSFETESKFGTNWGNLTEIKPVIGYTLRGGWRTQRLSVQKRANSVPLRKRTTPRV